MSLQPRPELRSRATGGQVSSRTVISSRDDSSALHVVPLRRSASQRRRLLSAPFPAADGRNVVAVLFDVLLVLDQFVVNRLLEISGPRAELRQAVDHVLH